MKDHEPGPDAECAVRLLAALLVSAAEESGEGSSDDGGRQARS